jgi:hypothetical protein
MTDKAISPLRQRMIEDMTIRKFAPKTQHDYLQRVKNFATFLGRSPDTASFEDVRRYQLHLATSGTGVPTLNQSVSTLRFFFRITLGRADILNHTQFVHEPRMLPVVLSPEEVARFLEAAPGLKYKTALSVAYGAGLRVSEVVALKVCSIPFKGIQRYRRRRQRPNVSKLNGSVAEAFYQPEPFWASDDVNVFYPRFPIDAVLAMFLCTIIRREKYRFNYGRKWNLERMNESEIRLPANADGAPDWAWMRQYILSQNFSSQLYEDAKDVAVAKQRILEIAEPRKLIQGDELQMRLEAVRTKT